MTRLDAALDYTRRGRRVIPLYSIHDGRCTCGRSDCDSPGKHPRLAAWPTRATIDERTIVAWVTRWPNANVGIVTGNGLLVLDVDPRHGGDTSLADLERQHGALPDTPRVLTGGGGVQHYFAVAQPVGNRTGLVQGIDVRGDGGFVVAPPSLHASGQRYVWEVGAGLDDLPLAPAPDWLVERVRSGRTNGTPRPPDEWAALVHGPIPAGARNDSLARLAGYLLRCRPAPHVELVRAVNEARCRPPLSEDEIARTVDSIARRELARRQDGLW